MSDADFAVFAQLRKERNEFAERQGVAPYIVFTNEQLAEMVRQRVTSKAALKKIVGVGEAKITKYGDAFLRILGKNVKQDEPPSDPATNHEAQ